MTVTHNYSIKKTEFLIDHWLEKLKKKNGKKISLTWTVITTTCVTWWHFESKLCSMEPQSHDSVKDCFFGNHVTSSASVHIQGCTVNMASSCVTYHSLHFHLQQMCECHWDMHIHLLHQLGGPITSHIINPRHVVCHNPSGWM